MSDEGIILPGGGRQFKMPVQQVDLQIANPDGTVRVLSLAMPAFMGSNVTEAAFAMRLDNITKLLVELLSETASLRVALTPQTQKTKRGFHPPTGENNHRG